MAKQLLGTSLAGLALVANIGTIYVQDDLDSKMGRLRLVKRHHIEQSRHIS